MTVTTLAPPTSPDEPEPNRRNWRDYARCRDTDPELWHTPAGQKIARTICAGCPVTDWCTESTRGLPLDADHGVFGGLTATARASLPRTGRVPHCASTAPRRDGVEFIPAIVSWRSPTDRRN